MGGYKYGLSTTHDILVIISKRKARELVTAAFYNPTFQFGKSQRNFGCHVISYFMRKFGVLTNSPTWKPRKRFHGSLTFQLTIPSTELTAGSFVLSQLVIEDTDR